MSHQDIIASINTHKKQPNLRFRLKRDTETFTDLLFYTLFDIETPVSENLGILEKQFDNLVDLACWESEKPCKKVWENYVAKLPTILESLNLDAEATVNCDPASLSIEEVYMAYPGFYAIAIYRLAHELYQTGFPLVPRLMTEYAHRQTGVDINPGAQIGMPMLRYWEVIPLSVPIVSSAEMHGLPLRYPHIPPFSIPQK